MWWSHKACPLNWLNFSWAKILPILEKVEMVSINFVWIIDKINKVIEKQKLPRLIFFFQSDNLKDVYRDLSNKLIYFGLTHLWIGVCVLNFLCWYPMIGWQQYSNLEFVSQFCWTMEFNWFIITLRWFFFLLQDMY